MILHYILAAITFAVVWVWLVAHQIVIYAVFNAMVDQLPHPDANSSTAYRLFYALLQFIAMNLTRSKAAVLKK